MDEILDDKTKELIAIGASIGAHCQPCLTHHINKAKKFGVGLELIRAAVDVGHRVEKGAMAAMRDFEQGILDDTPNPGATRGTNCCG